MKIFIVTDMEGVCGVKDNENWVTSTGRYFEEGRKLLTGEVNAAIEGFFNAGAKEILVVDTHSPSVPGGGIIHSMLDERVEYMRGFHQYPFQLDSSYDAIAWVGQHAKSGSEYAHLPHSNDYKVRNYTINGIHVGEFGIMAFCAITMGVFPIFCSGDRALVKEAKELIGGIEAVEVKRGLIPGTGDECSHEEYRTRNLAAIHLSPVKARKLICEGAEKALKRLKEDKSSFRMPDIKPPYVKEVEYRPGKGTNAYKTKTTDMGDLIRLLQAPERIIEYWEM